MIQPVSFGRVVANRVARLTDDASVRAYETLGDRPTAAQILERRLFEAATNSDSVPA